MATREKVDAFMAAIEAGDGARIYRVCSPSAQIFDSNGNVFLDLAALGSAEATAKDFAEKMGETRLAYSDREVQLDADTAAETHTVMVFAAPSDTEPVAVVKVKVVLTFVDGEIVKSEETALDS